MINWIVRRTIYSRLFLLNIGAVSDKTVSAAVRKAREPNDKLDRATDNMLVLLKRIVKLYTGCADEVGWRDMEGYRCLKLKGKCGNF